MTLTGSHWTPHFVDAGRTIMPRRPRSVLMTGSLAGRTLWQHRSDAAVHCDMSRRVGVASARIMLKLIVIIVKMLTIVSSGQ